MLSKFKALAPALLAIVAIVAALPACPAGDETAEGEGE